MIDVLPVCSGTGHIKAPEQLNGAVSKYVRRRHRSSRCVPENEVSCGYAAVTKLCDPFRSEQYQGVGCQLNSRAERYRLTYFAELGQHGQNIWRVIWPSRRRRWWQSRSVE